MKKHRYLPGLKPLAMATLLGAGLLAGTQAQAVSLAANTGILNTVTVNFNDASGAAQTAITASVSVTVNLVAANPTLNAPADQTIAYGGTATYNYTITNNANGIETFAISAVDSPALAGSTATPSISSVTLGASTVEVATTIGASGTTNLTVPADLTVDQTLNGLVAGNTVVIDGAVFTISAVQYNLSGATTESGTTAVANGEAIIQVNGNGTALAVSVGDLIEQQVPFTLAVTSGSSSNDNVNQTDTATLSATDSGNSKSASDVTVTTVAGIGLTINKYVRNNTTAADNPATATVTVNGTAFYASGVTGNPGDTLEYLIVVAKGASASSATSVVVSDPILNFVTYATGSLQWDSCSGGAFSALTDAGGDDVGSYSAGNVTFAPANGQAPATGGTIGTSVTCNLTYNVTIQ